MENGCSAGKYFLINSKIIFLDSVSQQCQRVDYNKLFFFIYGAYGVLLLF